ncbi:lipase family protein [Colwellia sp. E2M01]|uniref:lipase family protein n=1 Tax=Colwellia sp. E2M01 TaxID=2841561 RepID=UPI001C08E629|nr:lipase family protein [Colwellia sp. E2M01]MBU2870477.1 lipase family protein [Colwellia sp. E2M01]
MSTISPHIASLLADTSYKIKDSGRAGYQLGKNAKKLNKFFTFDLSDGPVKGVSGGFLSHLFNRTTGFALLGQGKGVYKGDHVIAIRGTASLRDAITDAHVGLTGSATGTSVHAGFNKTFYSMKPAFQAYISQIQNKGSIGTVHCVGHSLGGALAGLTADWLKSEYGMPVNLYTFGSPRIGLSSFSAQTTARVDNIFRCTHGADPVPKVPLWPFIHAPYNGTEYRLNSGQGFNPSAHKMGVNGNPGYVNSAKGNDWGSLQRRSDNFLNTPVRLDYNNRNQASYSAYWADKISAALITLLKDEGYYQAILAQASVGSALTFYDLVSRTLVKVAQASVKRSKQVAGLLGHMLAFAGQTTYKLAELTYDVIKWVFDKTLGVLYRSVREAINSAM